MPFFHRGNGIWFLDGYLDGYTVETTVKESCGPQSTGTEWNQNQT